MPNRHSDDAGRWIAQIQSRVTIPSFTLSCAFERKMVAGGVGGEGATR
jgi:hypothetical protein